jgi:hypothetical protein
MRSMISGDFTADSFQRVTSPVAAYPGLTMWSGTARMGETTPGSMRPSNPLWQRL